MKALLAAICLTITLTFAAGASARDSGLAGKTLMPRQIAATGHTYWQNYELTKAVAVALAESAGSLGAWHDNLTLLSQTDAGQVVANPETGQKMTVLDPALGKVRLDDGTVERHPPESMVETSRDCGLYQINIPASQIDTTVEDSLRTVSTDPADYTPVWETNTRHALSLYNQPWTNRTLRRWQPWVAYTTGWATFPNWWVWHQDADKNPVGPWLPTGRYIQRAIAGQMNYHVVIAKDWTATVALSYAHRYAAHFGVADTLYVNTQGIVAWHIPPKPSAPPTDGVGPRPVPNDGA